MVDWDRIAELQQEVGEEDFTEVLTMFFDEFEETLENFDHGAAPEQIHFLKGSAANIGMQEVATLCRDAECALREGASSVDLLPGIMVSFENSRNALLELVA